LESFLWGFILPKSNLYGLKNVDYARSGQEVKILVDNASISQSVIFSGTDYYGDTYHFTEQGLRYITDSRSARPTQNFVLNYLDKIPIILKTPLIIGINTEKTENYLYFRKIAIKEFHYKKRLFVVILKKSNINVVWNFYWLSQNKVPQKTEILFRTRGSAKYLG
jgi:hypothetical protein